MRRPACSTYSCSGRRCQPFIGYQADRRNLRILVIIAPAISAVCMSLLGVAPTYAMLAFLLLIVGAGSAGLHAVGPVIAGNTAGQMGRAMGTWMVGGGLGYTIGPLVIGAISSRRASGHTVADDWRDHGVRRAVRQAARRHVVPERRRRGHGAKRSPQCAPCCSPSSASPYVRSFMAAALSTYLPLFLKGEGSTLWFAGAALAIFEAAGMAGSLTAGAASDRIGRRKVLRSRDGGRHAPHGRVHACEWRRPPAAARRARLLGLAIMPVMMALVQERFPENRAMANGLYLGLSFVANAAATLALGLFADAFSLRMAFMLALPRRCWGFRWWRCCPGARKRKEDACATSK